MHTMEHRWGQRVRVRRRIRVKCGDAVGSGLLLEVSLSGGILQTDLNPPLLSTVDIELKIAGETFRTSASVVRREFADLAFEWSDFAPKPACTLIGACSHGVERRVTSPTADIGAGLLLKPDELRVA